MNGVVRCHERVVCLLQPLLNLLNAGHHGAVVAIKELADPAKGHMQLLTAKIHCQLPGEYGIARLIATCQIIHANPVIFCNAL